MRRRDIFILVEALSFALVLAAVMMAGQVLPTGSWGLSFSGGTPKGPATQAQLGRFDGAYVGNTEDKVIYLTFDAGYENGCTGKILDILKAHQVPAAFFLAGNYLQKDRKSVV